MSRKKKVIKGKRHKRNENVFVMIYESIQFIYCRKIFMIFNDISTQVLEGRQVKFYLAM